MVRAVKVVPLAEGPDAYAGRSFGGGSAGSGRRGMGKVPSLVFDLDDLNEAAAHGGEQPLDEASVAEVQARLAALLEPWSEPEHMLLLHVRFAREDAAKRGAALSVADLADTLRRLGYAVKMRAALGGGAGGACLRCLRHSFLTVSVSSPTGPLTYVLDPRFREQFEIAHATPRYSRVLEAVGPELVASQDRLTRVVELLCAEMAHAFAETGTPLPPWRQAAAVLSKWLPRRSEEVDVTAALSSGTGPVGGAPAPGGSRRLTGPSTVAQRLMMLGVPAHLHSNPSPIAEGVEAGSGSPNGGGAEQADPFGRSGEADEDAWDGLDGPVSPPSSSSNSSLHLDWEEGSPKSGQRAPLPPPLCTTTARLPGADPGEPPPPPRRAASGAAAIPAPRAPPPSRGRAILDGIRAAAAALPHRRNNTWAG